MWRPQAARGAEVETAPRCRLRRGVDRSQSGGGGRGACCFWIWPEGSCIRTGAGRAAYFAQRRVMRDGSPCRKPHWGKGGTGALVEGAAHMRKGYTRSSTIHHYTALCESDWKERVSKHDAWGRQRRPDRPPWWGSGRGAQATTGRVQVDPRSG